MQFICTRNTFVNKDGFTLVEIMIVVVIIAFMGFFVAPEVMNWRPNMRLTDATQDIFANMQNAKVAAVERNSRAVVFFNEATNQYSVFIDNGAGSGTANNDTRDGTEEFLSFDEASNSYGLVSLPADVTYDAATDFTGSNNPGFNSRGLPILGRTGSVILRRTDSSKWCRIILGASGSMAMQRKASAAAAWE